MKRISIVMLGVLTVFLGASVFTAPHARAETGETKNIDCKDEVKDGTKGQVAGKTDESKKDDNKPQSVHPAE